MEFDDPEAINTEAEESDNSNISYSTTVPHQSEDPSSIPRLTALRRATPQFPSASLTMSSSDIKLAGFNPFSNLTVLKKGTFHEWKAKIVTALNAARLVRFILTDQIPPDDASKLEEHTVRDYQALSIIQTLVDSEHFQLVANASSARQAYLNILAHYDDSGGLSTAMLFSDLVSLRLEESGNLSDHVHRFRTLHNELLSNMMGTPDLKISETFVAILLLKSLSKSYSAIVQKTLSSFETIKLSRIYTILSMEGSRSQATSISSDAALAASTSNPSSKPYNQHKAKDKDVKCSLSHPGHTDEHCKVRRFREMEKDLAELKRERSGKSEQAQAATNKPADGYWESAFTTSERHIIKTDIADTGCSSHMFRDDKRFDFIHPSNPVSISVASTDGAITACHSGQVTLENITLKDVIHSDKLSSNLISIGKLCDEGNVAVFRRTEGTVLDSQGNTVLHLTRDPSTDRLWHPVSRFPSHSALATRTDKATAALLWHRRLGHLHPDAVIHFLKRMGKPLIKRSDFTGCDECMQGKSYQLTSTSSFHRSPKVLNLVHSDLLGPIHPPTRGGKKYILSFIDNYTRYNHVYLLSSKDETPTYFKKYKALVERQTGARIGKLKSDRGGEYSSVDFLQYLSDEGIETERGPAHRPPANSVSERFFRTLLGRMRTQLLQSGLPPSLWGELAVYCSLQLNCSPTRALDMHIPILEYQKVMVGHLHPFDFTRLRPFGCTAFVHQQHRHNKLSTTSKKMIFVGIEHGARACRLWDPETTRVLVSGDVKYQEDEFPGNSKKSHTSPAQTPHHVTLTFPAFYDTAPTTEPTQPPAVNPDVQDGHTTESITPSITVTPLVNTMPVDLPHPVEEVTNPPSPISNLGTGADETRRSTRTRRPTFRYGFSASDISSAEHDHPTYSQAMKGPERGAWMQACKEEFDSLLQHNVGTLVDPPDGANVLGGMWRLARKRDEHNRIVRYKARWVAFGNHQIKGLDYNET